MTSEPTKKALVNALIEEKRATPKSIASAERISRETKRSFEEAIIEQGIISLPELAALKARLAKIPTADLSGFIDPGVFSAVPETMIKNLGMLPFKKEGGRLFTAMADPWDFEAIEFLKKRTGLDIAVEFASRDAILKALSGAKEAGLEFKAPAASGKGEEEKNAGELIMRLVDAIIRNAVRQDASDIHIEPTEHDVLVRYRIDGILRDITRLPKEAGPAIIARVKVLANLKLDEHRLPQDGRFKLEIDKRRFSFRVSIMPVFDGEKAGLRILEEEGRTFTFEELGFSKDQWDAIIEGLSKPYGLILATGPTGSGKTTTLYTMLRILNKREVNIATVEDPIEYRLPGANQTQVRPEIGLSFANGLRSLLRQDPNIIMVGEIRDIETAALAIHAALTGHIVLSTLHTNDAAGALPRLLDMKVEGFLIASTASIIIAQRLVRRLCPDSKIPYKLSEAEYRELGKSVDIDALTPVLRRYGVIGEGQGLEDVTWHRPGPSVGCPDGYKSRIGIHEVLEITDPIRGLIFRGGNATEIKEAARKGGMLTMQEAGFLIAAQGITSIEEVLRATKE